MNREERRRAEREAARVNKHRGGAAQGHNRASGTDDEAPHFVAGMLLSGQVVRRLIRDGYIAANLDPIKTQEEILAYASRQGMIVERKTIQIIPDDEFVQQSQPDDVATRPIIDENSDAEVRAIRYPHTHDVSDVNACSTEHDQQAHEAERSIRQAVEAKRTGNFAEARRLYLSAVATCPSHLHCYFALGKINYLLGDQKSALLNYTVAAHLHLATGVSQDYDDNAHDVKEYILEGFSEETIKRFRSVHRYADLLLCDDNTPRHLAHALIDLSPTEHSIPEVTKAKAGYRQTIAKGTFVPLDHEVEFSVYQTAGTSYLLENILWTKVGKHPAEDVYRLYSEATSASFPQVVCDTELAWVFDQLSARIGLRIPDTKSPFGDLCEELGAVWERAGTDTTNDWQTLVLQAKQNVEELLSDSTQMSMGALMIDALGQGQASHLSTINRWRKVVGRLQTPFSDFVFKIWNEAQRSHTHTPVLNGIRCCLGTRDNRDIVDLRNGLTHGRCTLVRVGNRTYLDMKDTDSGAIIGTLEAVECEAFHGLLYLCALALEQHFKGLGRFASPN